MSSILSQFYIAGLGIKAQALRAASLLRLHAFDTSTEEGRSRERYRRAALTTAASVTAKGTAVLTGLISIPLTLRYLGAERFGLWMTILSIVSVLSFADLGMGSGLLNAVAEANGKNDRQSSRTYISSSFYLLTLVALTLGILFTIAYPHISWQKLFRVSSPQAVSEAGPAMMILVGCVLANIPLGIVNKVQSGYQEGFISSIWEILGNIVGLLGMIWIIHSQRGLPWLVLAMAGAPVLATLCNTAFWYHNSGAELRPAWKDFSWPAARTVMNVGILFCILQLGRVNTK